MQKDIGGLWEESISTCPKASGGIDLSRLRVSDTLILDLLPNFGQLVLDSSVAVLAPR